VNTDVAIIGGGHNGLTAAALLAKAGRKVVVLERRAVLGGLAAGEEFHPGYRTSGIFHDTNRLRPWVIDKLGLRTHGLRTAQVPPLFVPEQSGMGLVLHQDPERAAEELARLSERDVSGYREYRAYIEKVRPVILSVMDAAPPDIGDEAKLWPPTRMMPLLKSALGMFRLGQKDGLELLRVGPCPADDWTSEYFQSRLLRAALMAPSLLGTWLAPRSPSGAGMMLIGEAMSGQEIVGGPSRFVNGLTAVCRAAGVDLRTDSDVRRIRVQDGVVAGVELSTGETFDVGTVISSVDPRQTFLELIDALDLPSGLAREVRKIRARGCVAKVHLALAGAPAFTGRPGEVYERVAVAEDPVDLERAFDDVRMRCLPSRPPPLEIRIPSMSDPSLAPTGHHVVSILVSSAPHDLDAGWGAEQRDALGEAVITSLSRYVPNLRDVLVAHEVLTPRDLSERYGTSGGHLFHGELALDQFWAFRPSPTLSRYATPVAGLFLGGSGSHPMGGVTAAPGALCAQAVLDA